LFIGYKEHIIMMQIGFKISSKDNRKQIQQFFNDTSQFINK